MNVQQTTPVRVPQELVASSGFLLAKLGFAFKARVLTELEQAGFDPYDYSVLAILAEGARETQATIADAISLDPSRLVALLDSLEKRGLVARQRDPLDRRRHTVTITPAGTSALEQVRVVAREAEDEFLAALDADDRKALHDLLLRVASRNDPRCAFDPSASDPA